MTAPGIPGRAFTDQPRVRLRPTGRTVGACCCVRRAAELIHRRARLVLALTAVLTLIAGAVGAGVVGSLSNGGTSDPNAPSEIAQRQIVAASGVSSQP